MHLEAVLERIAKAAKRAGRDPQQVRIVAVTKTHPIERVREAAAAGLLDVGENRVQEALAKQEAWPDAPVRWHLIGHLQRNKAKLAAGRFALIHSLDSVRLAGALEQAAAASNAVQDVLVQVNVAREDQKDGCTPEEAEGLVAHALAQPHLRLRGMMAMAPFTDDVAVQRATFKGLRELRDRLQPAHGALRTAHPWELSMGMSSDFEIAVEEGATLLRLGTILFGERQP
jgi:pyridoxal phosphate enzyme (YggS family)